MTQHEEDERYIHVVSPHDTRRRTRSGRLVQPPRRLVPLRKPDGIIDMAHVRVHIIDKQHESDNEKSSDSYEYESESEEEEIEESESDLQDFIVNDSEDERYKSDSSYTCSSANEEESEDFTEYEEESSDEE